MPYRGLSLGGFVEARGADVAGRAGGVFGEVVLVAVFGREELRGRATSAIWKITLRAWVTTLAPVLMSFSRSVVSA